MTSFIKTLLALGLAVTGLSSVYANTFNSRVYIFNDSAHYKFTIVNGAQTLKLAPNEENELPLLGVSGNKPLLKMTAVEMTASGKYRFVFSATCHLETGKGWSDYEPGNGRTFLLVVGVYPSIVASQYNNIAKKHIDISCSALY